MKEITLDYVLERAKRCSTYSQFQQNYYILYKWMKAQGYLAEVERLLPPMSYEERGRLSSEARRYPDEELVSDAARYSTRLEWRRAGELERITGGFSRYGAAVKRGATFMRLCCAHMLKGERGGWSKYSDADICRIALNYEHKGDWKRSNVRSDAAAYQAALNRPEVFLKATQHMTPKASPYSHSYYVYACEFEDRHVYVGLSFRSTRKSEHTVRGPVREHAAVCPNYAFKVVQDSIAAPSEVQLAEKAWMERYASEGWTLLNQNRAGGLGTVRAVKWTKEAVLAEARKYATKQAWINGSQASYRIAKREGWFDEASAHMPKRDARHLVGRTVSAETRARQVAVAQRRAADPAWRAAHSAALKGRRLTQAHREAIRRGIVDKV